MSAKDEFQLETALTETRDLAISALSKTLPESFGIQLTKGQDDTPEIMLRQIYFALSYFEGLEDQKNDGGA